MPLFALVNTNIAFESEMLHGIVSPLGLGIILGLLLGKPIGITLISALAVKLGLAKLPEGAGWNHLVGVGLVAGIGFTMSVFIALLSFKDSALLQSEAKFSILLASLVAGIGGSIYLVNVKKQ